MTDVTVDGVKKATRYQCLDCGIAAPAPIVVKVANPKHAEHGRCSNRQACEQRQRRVANRAKERKP